ncbi:MAG TPA: phosphatidylserine decarboxylase [Acidobacteriota bacterium]|nr:phosphatidylserine decarboxylase [Acidobacteriota bacterium]
MIRDAYRFVIPLLALAVFFVFVHLAIVSVPLIVVAAFVCYFFRNPQRLIPSGDNLVVSPADGKVVRIFDLPDDGELPAGKGVSIFLNIFDVHVNRSPIEGELADLQYKRGMFKVAFDEVASHVNEQNILTLRGQGMLVVVKQIAGLIARRVICWKKPGNSLERGELIGLIRFGSRVDVLMPKQVKILVKVGERVKGGSSILGERL